MIKLAKGPVPDVLQRNAEEWTRTILDKLAAGEALTKADRSHYSHIQIKEAVVAETRGKCAYCESKIRHVAPGDIEHIVPKSEDPSRWFLWENLTLACPVCNINKGAFVGNHDTFVDPYTAEPEELFWFVGALIFAVPGNDAAAISERILQLNRPELIEKRSERLHGLIRQLEVVQRTTNPVLRGLLQSDFLEESKSENEFAALAREIVWLARAKGILPAP